MRILNKVLLAILVIAIGITGYYIGRNSKNNLISALPNGETGVKETASPAPLNEYDTVKYITPSYTPPTAKGGWTLVDEFYTDLTLDGKDDSIKLYTTAQKHNDEFLWDDAQNWLVEVCDNMGGYYTLFSDYISGGNVYISISEDNDNNKSVSVLINSSANIMVNKYTYSETGFVQKTLCDDKAINLLHSSIPFYK